MAKLMRLVRLLPAAISLAVAATAATAPMASADPAAATETAAPAAAPAPITPPAAAPAPVTTPAAPRFELLDRGDAVEVIAHGVKATRTAVMPVRQRLEVPIAAPPAIKRIAPGDATVKLVEISEESTPVLSVKLGLERADVKALSRFAQAIQVGDDLHLLVPRKLPEGDAAPKLPEPTALPAIAAHPTAVITPASNGSAAPAAPTPPAAIPPAAAAATIHPAAPVLGPRPDPGAPSAAMASNPALPAAGATSRPRSAADALAAGATATPLAGSAPTITAAAPAEGRTPLRPVLASDHDDAWSKISMFGALGLAAAGAGAWLMRRRRGQSQPLHSIEVIAQRSLGGKARIVWLTAGQHEMIVSVTAQQVHMLSQWRRTERTGSSPMPRLFADDEPRREPTLPAAVAADKPLSPAVSGLLRLRRTSQMAAVAVEPPDGDVEADAAWAKEILAATTGARR